MVIKNMEKWEKNGKMDGCLCFHPWYVFNFIVETEGKLHLFEFKEVRKLSSE